MCVYVCVYARSIYTKLGEAVTLLHKEDVELVLMEEILNHLGCKRCKTLAKATWAGTETSSIGSMANKHPLQDIPFIDHLSWPIEGENR